MSTAAKPARRRARAVPLESPALGDGELPAILSVLAPPIEEPPAEVANEKKRVKRSRPKRVARPQRAAAKKTTGVSSAASEATIEDLARAPDDAAPLDAESLLTPEITAAASGEETAANTSAASEPAGEPERARTTPPAAGPKATPRAPNRFGVILFAGLAAFIGAFAGNLAATEVHPHAAVEAAAVETKEAVEREAPARAAAIESAAPAEKPASSAAPSKSHPPHAPDLKPGSEAAATGAERHAAKER